METNIVTDILPPMPPMANSGLHVMSQNAVGQSNCSVL